MEVPSILLNKILTEAAKRNAFDLHLTVGSKPVMRAGGKLAEMENENIMTSEMINKIIASFMDKDEAAKLNEEKEIILVKDLGGNFRFRINGCFQKNQPSLSFHYINGAIKGLSEIGLPMEVKSFLNVNSGLLIISGAYGSGKTATVASLIEEINKTRKKHIITIESPIENLFVSKQSIIEQREVGRDVKSVTNGLEYCLSEDVDLVYVGKIKSDFLQAVPLIFELAAGNCLVILEMNTDTSVKAIEKILNLAEKKLSSEASRYSLADVLVGIIVQKLLPKHGGGLVLAYELLLTNSAVKSLIREGKIYQIENILQTSRKEGMVSMKKYIAELVDKELINRQEYQINF